MNDRNSEIISRADSGGTLRVTSGPRCGASLRKISAGRDVFRQARLDRADLFAQLYRERQVALDRRAIARERQEAAQQAQRRIGRDDRRHRRPRRAAPAPGTPACAAASCASRCRRARNRPRTGVPCTRQPLVATPDNDKLVGQHVVRVGRLARQRRLAGAAASRKHDADLGMAQAAAVDQHAAHARQDRRIQRRAKCSRPNSGFISQRAAAAVADPRPTAAALGGQLDREVPAPDSDRARGRDDGQRLRLGFSPPARRARAAPPTSA